MEVDPKKNFSSVNSIPKFFKNNELEILKDEINVYIAGLFILDGALEKNLKENKYKIMATTIVEITQRAAKKNEQQ